MQHKRRHPKTGMLLATLAAAVVVCVGILMTRDIPAPQTLVEKQLDAKAFLDQKQ